MLGTLLVPTTAAAGPITPSSQESAALQNLAAKIPGARVLWVRGDKIFEAAAAGGFATKLVTQGAIVERNPRFSPDGSQILTVRSDGVYLMKSDFSGASKVIPGGHTASWTADGKAITAIDVGGYKVLKYDLTSLGISTIYDAQQAPYNGQQVSQAAELRQGGRFLLVFRATPTHVTEIVDLQLKTYLANQEMTRGDCSPSWARDGSYLLTTARTTSRPVLKAGFSVGSSGGALTSSQHFVGLATPYKFYIHGERVSNDGKYVAYGGIIFEGPMTSALREIYVWRIGDPESAAVRLSFDTVEDESPDLFIPAPGALPKLTLTPTSLSFSAVQGGANPPGQKVTVSNGGSGTLAALSTQTTFGAGSGWLKVTAGGSGNNQTLDTTVNIGGLAPNTYSAAVKVSAAGAANSPQSFTVTLTVKAKSLPADKLALLLSPASLSFTAQQGAPAGVQTVTVTSSGTGTLGSVTTTVSYLNGEGWLTVTPGGSGNQQSLQNSVQIDGLAADTYGASVSVAAAGAANSPQSYSVSLTVAEAPAGTPQLDGGVTSSGRDGGAGGDGGVPAAERRGPSEGCAASGSPGSSSGGLLLSWLVPLLALGLRAAAAPRCRRRRAWTRRRRRG